MAFGGWNGSLGGRARWVSATSFLVLVLSWGASPTGAQEPLCGGVNLGDPCPNGIGESDGNLCTVPTCNAIFTEGECTGACALPFACGILPGCEPEIIVYGVCQDGDQSHHDLSCPPDGNSCTSESCSPSQGCVSTNRPNFTFCNDGLFCNGDDQCLSGQCTIHTNPPCAGNQCRTCNEISNTCVNRPNFSSCDDGLFCNGADSCLGGLCTVHINPPCDGADGDGDCSETCNEATNSCTGNDPNGSSCNDGLFCNGNDTCSNGLCVGHSGDPCPGADGDSDCSERCNELLNNCTAHDPNGSVCASDGEICTNDVCQFGTCSHLPANAGTVCRAASGACDVPETCNGVNGFCPANFFVSEGTECRGSTDACDPAEACTGTSGACPADIQDPDGDGDGVCDPLDNCVDDANALQEDVDFDLVGDVCDNCPDDCNPDQLDSDLDLNGGDACDACPAVDEDAPEHCTSGSPCCEPLLTASGSAGPSGPSCAPGGPTVITSADGNIQLTVPEGSVDEDTTLSITGVGFAGRELIFRTGSGLQYGGIFQPDGISFSPPILLTFTWPDVDDNGRVDDTNLREQRLKILHKFDHDDPESEADEIAGRCQDSPCVIDAITGVPVADDWGPTPDPDGNGLRACCDQGVNKYVAEIVSFSAYGLADPLCFPSEKDQMVLTKLGDPLGAQKLNVKGQTLLDHPFVPALDPIENGARIEIRDASENEVIDVQVPGGAFDAVTETGWKANAKGTTYTFKSKAGVEGITKVVLKWGNKKEPGLLKYKVIGKNMSLPVDSGELPLSAQVRLDSAQNNTGQCGQLQYDELPKLCGYDANGGKVLCR